MLSVDIICCDVHISSEQDAVEAYKVFNGRWYALRQLSCQFVPIRRWRSAICGEGSPLEHTCTIEHGVVALATSLTYFM